MASEMLRLQRQQQPTAPKRSEHSVQRELHRCAHAHLATGAHPIAIALRCKQNWINRHRLHSALVCVCHTRSFQAQTPRNADCAHGAGMRAVDSNTHETAVAATHAASNDSK